MFPRINSSSPLRSLYRKPSRVTFAAAAATFAAAAVAVAGIAGGSAGPPAAASTAAFGNFASFDPTVGPRLPGHVASQPGRSGAIAASAQRAAPAAGGSGQPAAPAGTSSRAQGSHAPRPSSPAHVQLDTRMGPNQKPARQQSAAAQAHAKRAQPAKAAHPAKAARPAKAAHPAKGAKPARKADHGKRAKPARPAHRTTPYTIYDSVNPSAIPHRQAAAVYSTGTYAAQPSELRGLGHVIWIDTTGGNPGASALDVEPGDATPSQAAGWVRSRLSANPHAAARVYTMQSEWPAVRAAVATLPGWMRARVHWWIADPTGVPHILPGADATQWYWGAHYDLTLARPGF